MARAWLRGCKVGPRDVASGSGMMKARIAGSDKQPCPLEPAALAETVTAALERIHTALYDAAANRLAA